MKRRELREKVRAAFGPRLEHVTPAGAREFLDSLFKEYLAQRSTNFFEITESAKSYEEIMADFFASTLDLPAEEAAIMLWLWAFEQHFTTMQEQYVERFLSLFENPQADSEEECNDTE